MDEDSSRHVQAFSQELETLYQTLQQQADGLLAQTIALCRPDDRDPKQLKDLKAGILGYQDCLFVCLTEPNVPPDNNKAERRIRQLVMKRERSVSLKSQKGAHIMEVLLSVCWSLWYRDRDSFFPNLQQLTGTMA